MAVTTPGEMPLAEHLRELRSRLVRIILAVLLGSVAGWFLYDPVFELIKRPYCDLPSAYRDSQGECALIVTRVLEAFGVHVKVALVIGVFLAAPVVFFQIWRFIVPGLTSRERRYTLPFVLLSQVMFVLGGAFAYVVIPKGLKILLGLGGDEIATVLTASDYFSFILTSVIAFRLVFEVPLLIVFLAAVGVVSAALLRRYRAHAIVLNFVVAALVTPSVDAVTMLFMAVPMVLLYEASILAAWLIEHSRRRREREQQEPEPAAAGRDRRGGTDGGQS